MNDMKIGIKGNELETKHQTFEYDEKGRVIYRKDKIIGLEVWYEYIDQGENKGGYKAYIKYSDGLEYWNVYNSDDNVIYSKDLDGIEYWYEYDEKERVTHTKNTKGFEYYYEYEDNDKILRITDAEGNVWHKNLIPLRNGSGKMTLLEA